MDNLPQDPFILVSSVNMLLRDNEFSSLEELCEHFDKDINQIKEYEAEARKQNIEWAIKD